MIMENIKFNGHIFRKSLRAQIPGSGAEKGVSKNNNFTK